MIPTVSGEGEVELAGGGPEGDGWVAQWRGISSRQNNRRYGLSIGLKKRLGEGRASAGLTFCPTPQQLVDFFLKRKNHLQPINKGFLPEANVYGDHPANTTAAFPMSNKDGELFFFTHRSPPLGNGKRVSRTAGPGRWKATQATKDVVDHHGPVIGSRQSFCYEVQSPSGYIKSDWLMEEYARSDASERLWVICKVYMTPKLQAKLLWGIIGASNTVEEQETMAAPPHRPLPRLVNVKDPSGGDGRRKRRRTSTEDAGVVPAASVPVQRRSDVGENSSAIILPTDTCAITGESHTDYNSLDDSGLNLCPEAGEFFISSPQPQLLTSAPDHIQLVPESLATVGEASSAAAAAAAKPDMDYTFLDDSEIPVTPVRDDFWTISSQLGLLTDASDHI
ncbi:No apical meristem (NAM) protein [Musa troglodytarum]|uniref:No apical meristem (NAM) protein n=1 Tax=Musa troglodytarum TaxID=320322 RepID=A0A9E7KKM3_9LILI|nr:No apical meristem (NAM) protein [Musa troglodytarum]